MLKASSTLCAFLALASRNLMFRESASPFVSPVDTTLFDGSSHLFPTRSLLTPSAACLSISFTSMRVVFTPRRLISFERCLVQPCLRQFNFSNRAFDNEREKSIPSKRESISMVACMEEDRVKQVTRDPQRFSTQSSLT